MKALKTIVATAVIVFALTTVAMAGVQHFTKQSGQATGTKAQTAQPTYAVALTAAQLARLMTAARPRRHARRGRRSSAQQTQQHAETARHQTRSHAVANTTHASASGSGGTRHYEATHHAGSSTSSSSSHHAETGHHSAAVKADPAVTDQHSRRTGKDRPSASRSLPRGKRLRPALHQSSLKPGPPELMPSPPATDPDLVRGLRAGCRDAFERLYGDYHAPIYNLCARVLGDREEAKDVTQEVFIKAFDQMPATEAESFASATLALPRGYERLLQHFALAAQA